MRLRLLAVAATALATVYPGAASTSPAQLSNSPAAGLECFGAAARDPEHPCRNPELDFAVIPTPAEALAAPWAPCTRVEDDQIDVCSFGVPATEATQTIALLGDSHASHWRGAFLGVATAERWHGLSITVSGCPFSVRLRRLRRELVAKCLNQNRQLPGWFARHPWIHNVFVVQDSGQRWIVEPGEKPFEAEVTGFIQAWKLLPASVRRIVVIRDTPKESAGTPACIERAIAEHERPGAACARKRRVALFPDAEYVAAGRVKTGRVRRIDMTPFMCDRSRCYPVVGGALVHKDSHHLTTVFATTLEPYLGQALRRMGIASANYPSASPKALAAWAVDPYPRACPIAFGFNAAGRGVAVSGYTGSVGQLDEPPTTLGTWAPLTIDGEFGRTGHLGYQPAGIALYDTDGFGVIGYSGRSGKLRPPYRVYASVGTISKGAGRPHRLRGRYGQTGSLGLTVSARGRVVALHSGARRELGGSVAEIVLTTNRLRKTTLLARGRDLGPARIAGNARGDTVVAWRNGRSIYARIRTAGGRLGARQRIGTSANAATIVPGIDRRGHAFVAWSSAPVAGGITTGNRQVAIALRAPGKRFASARRLDTIPAPASMTDDASLQAAFAGNRIVVAWTAITLGPRSRGVEVELLSVGGERLARLTAAGPDSRAELSALATEPSGTVALAWTTGAEITPYLGVLAPGATALSVERIGDERIHDGPKLAIDPQSRSIVAFGPTSPAGCWFAVRRTGGVG